jgi:7-carboxy-7-deazaguanine synthase
LIDELSEKDYSVAIETNGSMNIKSLTKKENILISMDVKCPSSKMHKKNILENIKYLEEKDQVKFIIADKKDYNYAKETIKKIEPKCDVFFQPIWGNNYEKLAKWILQDRLNVKLGLQLHKIIWGDKRGV